MKARYSILVVLVLIISVFFSFSIAAYADNDIWSILSDTFSELSDQAAQMGSTLEGSFNSITEEIGNSEGVSSITGFLNDTTTALTSAGTATAPDAKTTYDYQGETIIDNEYFTFKINGVDPDDFWGYALKVYCENKTSKNLTFAVENVSVNGMMNDPFWATDVVAGKKENSSMTFSLNSEEEVQEIAFTLRIHDADDWMADALLEREYSIYPTGLSAETVNYQKMDLSYAAIVLDNDVATFAITGIDKDNIWGYTINAYCDNKTSKNLTISWDDVSVNGYMIDPFWATGVAAGKSSMSDISFSNSDFEENYISNVDEIEFTLRISDADDWFVDPYFVSTFKYCP